MMIVTESIKYIGVNDYDIDLFEGLYKAPNGMSYNSYVILDEKIAVMDTVEVRFTEQWLANIQKVLGERTPDYLIVQHMEPDHSANIMSLVKKYPQIIIVASEKAFVMMNHFFGTEFAERRIVVSDGDMLSLGKHTLTFLSAMMVHWPEVIMTYDNTEKLLFSADAFGTFGVPDVQTDSREEWAKEAARYYFGIVGKYGISVQKILHKLADKEIRTICPLHGAVLTESVADYIDLYNIWSDYRPEKEGVLIAYTSVYGNTKQAVMLLAEKLKEKGAVHVEIRDIARCEQYEAVAEAFRYSKLVLATTTYSTDIFPPMREFIENLTGRNFSNRMVAFIENGSWMPVAAKIMRERLEKCKGLVFADTSVKIVSALSAENIEELDVLACELCN